MGNSPVKSSHNLRFKRRHSFDYNFFRKNKKKSQNIETNKRSKSTQQSPKKMKNNKKLTIESVNKECIFSPSNTKQSIISTNEEIENDNVNNSVNNNSNNNKNNKNNLIIGNRFCLKRKLGKGSFGVTYKCIDLTTNKQVALKLEKQRQIGSNREIEILKLLSNCDRTAKLLWYGNFKHYKSMALELCGPNLSTLFELNNKIFNLKSCIHIAIEILLCMESIHSYGIVHRDIKPQNFVVGLEDPTQIFIIDFGLSSYFINLQTNEHISYIDKCSPVGTARYASLNNHKGIHQTRRDDLESIGYMFVYFLKSKLPWQGLQQNNRIKKWKQIQNIKQSISNNNLTKNIPNEFCIYLDYVKSLNFNQRPDYKKLRHLFKNLYIKNKYKYDYLFDWTTQESDEEIIN